MIDEKSKRALELNTIIEHLCQYCQTDHGREVCETITPSNDLSTVDRILKETSEMRHLLSIKMAPQLYETPDIRPCYERLQQTGTYISETEMLEVLALITRARHIREDISSMDEMIVPHLQALVERVKPQEELEKEIDERIDPAGFVRDKASKALTKIRKQMKSTHDKIYKTLENILNSRKYSSIIADSNIVIRNNRFCIPVRTDGLGKIEGIIQGRSGSGMTVFFEPYSITDLNNELSSLKEDEASEVIKILIELTTRIGRKLSHIEVMEETLTDLDLIKARANLSNDYNGVMPELTESGEIILFNAYNPLLYILSLKNNKDPTETVIPIDFHLGGEVKTVVVSGPNAGGKTVTLKTVSTIIYLALCGIHIPVKEGSTIPIPTNILTDIGEEQSIMESLSSFTAHISRIKEVLMDAKRGSLVVIDELGIGTDPTYGEALSIAIVDYLTDTGSYNLITTHYDGLKTHIFNSDGMVNASVEFSITRHKPTYHLIWNSFGHSHAFDIARELDFPENILNRAIGLIDEERLNLEDFLANLEVEKGNVRSLENTLTHKLEQVENERIRLERELGGIKELRREEKRKANREARKMIEDLRDELRRMKKEAEEYERTSIHKNLEKLADMKRDFPEITPDEGELPTSENIEVGDYVKSSSFGFEGKVEAIENDRALITMGGVKTEVELSSLLKVTPTDEDTGEVSISVNGGERAITSINVRGMTVDEALSEVDAYVDAGYLQGLPSLEIIHGLGTGRLRDGIRHYLRTHSLVDGLSPALPQDGGDGVTIVKFKKKDT